MAIREGKWRCPYCAQVNRGADLACPGCGATRDKDVAFFLEEEAPEVLEAAHLALAQAGADWLCAFCQTSNRPGDAACGNCGAARGTSPSRATRELRPEPAPAAAAASPPVSRRRGCFVVAGLLLVLAVGFCSFIAYRSLRKTEEVVTVAGFEWERSIDVEALRTVREEAWEGEVPAGARVRGRRKAVHHTDRVQTGSERVKVGTRDLGNGFFEDVYEDRPVYREEEVHRTKIAYDIDRWVKARTDTARGGDTSPDWPALPSARDERPGQRKEAYILILQGKDGTYRMAFDTPERWAAYRPGETFTAVLRGGSTVMELR